MSVCERERGNERYGVCVCVSVIEQDGFEK
jgi:hypothetical protein